MTHPYVPPINERINDHCGVTPASVPWPSIAQADEQEAPVLEELRRLAFDGVAGELENPAGDE
jgi:hypothetical protein